MSDRVDCKICSASILAATAERTGGVCMPCSKDPGKFDRKKKEEEESRNRKSVWPFYGATTVRWETPQAVDWDHVCEVLEVYLREVVATFSRENAERVVYGMVVETGQNWDLSVYLNTEEGYLSMPERFRKEFASYAGETDAELLESLGRWDHQSWEFDLYQFKCRPEVNAVNMIHYDLFDRLFGDDSVSHGEVNLSELFLNACARAVARLERSEEIHALRRTEDFEIRFYDANCHEWDTGSVMEAARERVDNKWGQ